MFTELEFNKVAYLLENDTILIVSATDLETIHIHQKLKPLNGHNKIIRVFEGPNTYYIGKFGEYKTVHVQCGMGSISPDGSAMTVKIALDLLKCKIVIMVGIAFGVDDTKQNIGDVLISRSILPYDIKKESSTPIPRGIEAPASQILLNRFKASKLTWEHILPDKKRAQLIPTRLLSGEALIDNLEFRNGLIDIFPESAGGEMEGAGIYAACCNQNTQWIIVKGICDFADGNKAQNKQRKQEIAIEAALSICTEIFGSHSAFKDLDISPAENQTCSASPQRDIVNDALSEYYDLNKDKYFLKREPDNRIGAILEQSSVWIFGPSGCGKSNVAIRSLMNCNKSHITINLALCSSENVDDYFNEILMDLSTHVGIDIPPPLAFKDCCKAIIHLLDSHFSCDDFIIFIEEIPISSVHEYQEFTHKLLSLLILKSPKSGLDQIKFILSSINSPLIHITEKHQKIHEQMVFLQLNFWADNEIAALIDIITTAVGIELEREVVSQISNAAAGSPRFLKILFRNLYTQQKYDADTINSVITETKRDLRRVANA